ncbi:MAG: permease, partial [Candidatus Latescibacterota bacterium]|nr:permease [Candidatus Latescibacterota bacterium]
LSFLVAMPELSIDAVLISLPLLGGEFTFVRVACAAAVALLAGWGVGRWVVPHVTPQREVLSEELPMRAQSRLVHSLKTGLVDVVDDTAPWIMLGLGVAALADALLLTNALNSIPDWSEVALFALLGIPTYVCVSGATPLAAVLVYKGVSPGASLAFLLTGPATNLMTFGVLARLHGRRLAMAFATAIMVLSILLGWGVNVVSPVVEAPALKLGSALRWRNWEGLCFLALCALFLASFVRMGPRAFVSEIASDGEPDHDHHHGEDACCAAETACASDHAYLTHND